MCKLSKNEIFCGEKRFLKRVKSDFVKSPKIFPEDIDDLR